MGKRQIQRLYSERFTTYIRHVGYLLPHQSTLDLTRRCEARWSLRHAVLPDNNRLYTNAVLHFMITHT